MSKAPVSVIVLTYNEEVNIRACLESVIDLTDEIFIVDSFSTDRTLEVAREYNAKIYQNPWEHFAQQRNWALEHLPLSNAWVLFLDADERLSVDLSKEIKLKLNSFSDTIDGYFIKRNFYFIGRWIKYGGYQSDYILRLLRKKSAKIIQRGAWEYATINGKTDTLKHHMIHEDLRGVTFWINKHNNYSSIESGGLYNSLKSTEKLENDKINSDVTIEHSFQLWLRENIWRKMPLFVRPFFYFIYRYIFRLGFLDGKEGFIYCFLHGLWYPVLVDTKYYELIKKSTYKNKL